MASQTIELCLAELQSAFPASFLKLGETNGSVSLELRDGRKQSCFFWCHREGDIWEAASPISSERDVDIDELMQISDIDLPVTLIEGKPFLFNRIVMNAPQSAAIIDFVGQTANYADYVQQKLFGLDHDE